MFSIHIDMNNLKTIINPVQNLWHVDVDIGLLVLFPKYY